MIWDGEVERVEAGEWTGSQTGALGMGGLVRLPGAKSAVQRCRNSGRN